MAPESWVTENVPEYGLGFDVVIMVNIVDDPLVHRFRRQLGTRKPHCGFCTVISTAC